MTSSIWHVRVETTDGQVKEFKALSCYELTDEQKVLWRTATGQERVTNMRIKSITEKKEQNPYMK